MIKFFLIILITMASVNSFASRRSDLNQQILKQYGDALDDASKQKTAGLLRSAAAKSKAQKAQNSVSSMKTTLIKIQENLNQSNQS